MQRAGVSKMIRGIREHTRSGGIGIDPSSGRALADAPGDPRYGTETRHLSRCALEPVRLEVETFRFATTRSRG